MVSAVNASGESVYSSEANATPTGGVQTPPTPLGLIATAGNAQVVLSWLSSSGATSYTVKRSTTSGGPYTQIANPTATTYTDTGLTNGTPYYYVVSAANSAGESANSAQVSATPAATTVNVTITINPANTKAISPYIYGLNFYSGNSDAPSLLTFDRAGGNRWTAYNWINNGSNAGSDYFYENDNYLCNGSCNAGIPAEAVRTFIAADQTERNGQPGDTSTARLCLGGHHDCSGTQAISKSEVLPPRSLQEEHRLESPHSRSRHRPPLPITTFTWMSSPGPSIKSFRHEYFRRNSDPSHFY